MSNEQLMTRVAELERTLAEAKERWSNECAELEADRDFWDRKAGEEHVKVQELETRLQIDPGGSDKIDELEQALQFVQHRVQELEREVARLRQADKTGALCPQCGFETVTSSVTMEAFETVCEERDSALARLANASPDEQLFLVEQLQDALLTVEWVRSHDRTWRCAFCGGQREEEGGDGHRDGCEWQRLVAWSPTDATP